MNLKSILKAIKLNENTISMVLGALVILVVGYMVISYFRNMEPGNTLPSGVNTEDNQTLPTEHTVAKGETLWSISEKYYDSGYNWVDIQKANNITNPNSLAEGQVLTIPDVQPKHPEDRFSQEASTASADKMAEATPEPTPVKETVKSVQAQVPTTEQKSSTYTVVHGDNLWKIAENQYGDGFKWKEIAAANHLANPRVIHAGNILALP